MDEKSCELKKIMQTKLAAAKLKNPHYSLRAFAKLVNETPSSISEFFNNKRKYSDKKIREILEHLGMSPLEITEFEDAHRGVKRVILEHEVERLKIDSDLFFLVSNPIYYTLLALIETKDFIYDYKDISERIGHSESEIQVALTKLLELNFVKEVKKGKKLTLKVNTPHLDTLSSASDPVPALRLRHQQNLDAANEALHTLPVSERFFTFETLAIEKEKLPQVQELMFRFLDELHNISSNSNKDEVYEFCFQYFPRTKKKNSTH